MHNEFQPLYIFDLDGTLALNAHRHHFVTGAKKDWDAFNKACVYDEPNFPVLRTMELLAVAGAEVVIWSGRSDAVLLETRRWLEKYDIRVPIKMRPDGDHQPDVDLKGGWLEAMPDIDRKRLVAIFDDRECVVEMWRSKGIACFQVAPGKF